MTDTQATPEAPAEGSKEQQEQAQTFSQADVDRIVADRLKRERETTRAKFADYDELKVKAGEKATVEDRLAAMEKRAADAEARALRSDIAARFGVSTEDRDLFLTATDEQTLTAQAERLATRDSERKKQGNHVPNEGNNPRNTSDDDPMRSFVRGVFDRE